jgi:hypothetical protein
MGIEIQGLPYGIAPGQMATFTFQYEVQAYVIGITGFSLTYGSGTDHWIHICSLKLSSIVTATGVVGNVVTAKVDAVLSDSSGNTIDITDSVIYPVCMAVTDVDDPNTVLTNYLGISSSSPAGFQLPSTSVCPVQVTCLAGFDFAYTSGDHQTLQASAVCGITSNQEQATVTGSAAMGDAKGNNVNTATVDVGVIVSADANPGFAVVPTNAQSFGPVTVTFPSLTSIKEAVVLIQSWAVAYDTVHNVQGIKVGSWGAPTIDGNTVTLPNLFAQMWDNSNHWQDDSKSNAAVLVIAIPE